jgi:hypothetical protein
MQELHMSEYNENNAKSAQNIKTHLKASLEQMLAAGHDVKEYSEFVLDNFNERYIPHLRQFLSDVSRGEIKIKGLTKAAREKIIGHHVSDEERQAMINEAAYYLAEKRGFTGGNVEEDWDAAERQIETRLAQEAGLLEKGRKLTETAVEKAEQELGNMVTILQKWIEEQQGTKKRTTVKKKVAARKKSSVKKTPAKKKATDKKSSDDKKSKSSKKKDKYTREKVPAKITSAKKKSAKKKPTRKKD